MKIILTERQQNLITENLTDENLRKFCYQIWNKQKKMGEEPNLDDVIYDITDIKKIQGKITILLDQFGMNTMEVMMYYLKNLKIKLTLRNIS